MRRVWIRASVRYRAIVLRINRALKRINLYFSCQLIVTPDSPVIIAHYAGGDQEAAGVRPGDGGELSPPPDNHNTEGGEM